MAADVLAGTDKGLHGLDRRPTAIRRPRPARAPAAAVRTAAGGVRLRRAEPSRNEPESNRVEPTMTDHRIVFTPSGVARCRSPTARPCSRPPAELGVDLDTVCGGRGICGRCQVVPGTGSFAEVGHRRGSADAVSPPGRPPRPTIEGQPSRSARGSASAVRARRSMAIVVVDVPPDQPGAPSGRPQGSRSAAHHRSIRSFTLWYVEIERPELGDDASLADLVRDAVAEQHARTAPSVSRCVRWRCCSPPIVQGDGAVTVVVDDRDDVVAVWPGIRRRRRTAWPSMSGRPRSRATSAISTSGEVLASAGRMNPQIRFGEDLMSRVSYAMMNPGGDRDLTESGANGGRRSDRRTRRPGPHLPRVRPRGQCSSATPSCTTSSWVSTPNRSARRRSPSPRPGAHDARCRSRSHPALRALLRRALYRRSRRRRHRGGDPRPGAARSSTTQLVVDVGTNAEIVLGDSERLYAASSPTGPAFEGAQIASGQRATAGAIERVRIDIETLEPRIKVIGVDAWSDDDDFAVEVKATGVTGICGSGIIDVVAEMFLAGIVDSHGVIDGSLAARSDRVVADGRTFSYLLWRHGDAEIVVTQNDVRAIQLARLRCAPASICSSNMPAGLSSARSTSPAPSEHTSIRCVRWCSASCPMSRPIASGASGTRPASARSRPCCREHCGTSWRPSLATSSRSRPRPRRGSRRCSSRRWRCHTRPPPPHISPRSSLCPTRHRSPTARRDGAAGEEHPNE